MPTRNADEVRSLRHLRVATIAVVCGGALLAIMQPGPLGSNHDPVPGITATTPPVGTVVDAGTTARESDGISVALDGPGSPHVSTRRDRTLDRSATAGAVNRPIDQINPGCPTAIQNDPGDPCPCPSGDAPRNGGGDPCTTTTTIAPTTTEPATTTTEPAVTTSTTVPATSTTSTTAPATTTTTEPAITTTTTTEPAVTTTTEPAVTTTTEPAVTTTTEPAVTTTTEPAVTTTTAPLATTTTSVASAGPTTSTTVPAAVTTTTVQQSSGGPTTSTTSPARVTTTTRPRTSPLPSTGGSSYTWVAIAVPLIWLGLGLVAVSRRALRR